MGTKQNYIKTNINRLYTNKNEGNYNNNYIEFKAKINLFRNLSFSIFI